MQCLLYALSDPVRVRIFAELDGGEDGRNCAAFLNVRQISLLKSSLSQHFKVLRESWLIRGERNGVELKNDTRYGELQKKYRKHIPTILQAYRKENR